MAGSFAARVQPGSLQATGSHLKASKSYTVKVGTSLAPLVLLAVNMLPSSLISSKNAFALPRSSLRDVGAICNSLVAFSLEKTAAFLWVCGFSGGECKYSS